MKNVDTVVKGGRLVSPQGIIEAGIAIEDGKIVAIAKDTNLPRANTVIDVNGNFIIPGVVDDHVHAFQHEDFLSCSKAAAAGGVTTIMDHPIMPPTTTTTHALKEKKRLCKEQSLVDFALYGGALSTNLDDMPKLVEAGVVGFKTGLCDIVKSIFPRLNDAEILEVFKRVREIGSGVGVHAENDEIITYLTEKLQKSGRVDPLAHGESRPVIAELEATSRAILLAAEAGNRLHIFHMSIASGADLVQRAKAGGQAVTAETCPHYLVLNEDHVKELKAYGKMNPPIRSKEEVEKLWKALREGKIDNIASDHAPWPKEEKDKGDENIWNAPGGFPGIQSMLTLMLNEGVNKGRITLESLVALVCENPARIWKIYPQKGAIQLGSDADLTIVDLKREGVLRADKEYTRVGWTTYEGWRVKGFPVLTIVRGNVVAEDDAAVGKPGLGEFVRPLH